jgi:hypothetical protein
VSSRSGLQDGTFMLRGRAAWAHDFNLDRSIGATFQTLPGASFVVNGAAHASDPALVTASDEMKWLNGILLASTFANSLTSPPAMPARAWCDMRGETGFVVSLLLQLQENGWRPEQSTYGI